MEQQSYEEIFSRMRQSFQEKAGFVPEDHSELGIRLRVLAGEVLNLSNGMDWLERQAFPQTAGGSYLDLHAQARGLTRAGETTAAGSLIFGRAQAVNYALTIPKGTICALTSDSEVRFYTTEAATLPAGETTVSIAAVSESGGTDANAAADTITTMITPPVGIETVTNTAFSGGTEQETDEQLRRRLLQRFTLESNGMNRAYYIRFAMEQEGVYSANAVKDSTTGAITLYVCGKSGNLSETALAQLQAKIEAEREIGASISVSSPASKNVTFGVSIQPAAPYTFAEIKPNCLSIIQSYIESLGIGQSFYAAKVLQELMNSGLLENYAKTSYTMDTTATESQRLVAKTISITELS